MIVAEEEQLKILREMNKGSTSTFPLYYLAGILAVILIGIALFILVALYSKDKESPPDGEELTDLVRTCSGEIIFVDRDTGDSKMLVATDEGSSTVDAGDFSPVEGSLFYIDTLPPVTFENYTLIQTRFRSSTNNGQCLISANSKVALNRIENSANKGFCWVQIGVNPLTQNTSIAYIGSKTLSQVTIDFLLTTGFMISEELATPVYCTSSSTVPVCKTVARVLTIDGVCDTSV